MGAEPRPPGRVLAEFAAGLDLEAIPEHTRERVKDLLLDALGSARLRARIPRYVSPYVE